MSLETIFSAEYSCDDLSYITGLEVTDDQGILDLDACMQAIQDSMHQRNPKKYGNFIKSLKKTEKLMRVMRVPDIEKRIKLFIYTYYAMRLLDDICDGDLNVALDTEQVRDIIYNAAGKTSAENVFGLYEILIQQVRELSSELGIEDPMTYSIQQIAKSLMFDLDRSQDENKLRSKEALEKNFDMMDIIGTEYGVAVILGLDPSIATDRLTDLGVACRIGYNIKDLIDDIYKGLINIPQEDLETYGISTKDLEQIKRHWNPSEIHSFSELFTMGIPQSILAWLQDEVHRMNLLVDTFKTQYSVAGILLGKQSIPAIYKQNFIRKKFNNLLIRCLVIPEVYLLDIKKSEEGDQGKLTWRDKWS